MRCLLLDRCECLGKPASNRCDSSSISWHPFAVEAGIAPAVPTIHQVRFWNGRTATVHLTAAHDSFARVRLHSRQHF
jgi:hypothetical protein